MVPVSFVLEFEESLKEVGQVFDPRGDWATTRHGISRGVPGMEEPPLESKGAKKKKKKPKPAGAGPAADSDEDEARARAHTHTHTHTHTPCC